MISKNIYLGRFYYIIQMYVAIYTDTQIGLPLLLLLLLSGTTQHPIVVNQEMLFFLF